VATRLSELTYPEAEALRGRADLVALLPIGSTEAHGPHLPLGTDAIISDELAARAADALATRGRAALILPSITFAVTDFARPFSGTLSISAATATGLVADVCAAAIEQGYAKVCLVNSHLEPAHIATLEAAGRAAEARTGARVAFANHLRRRFVSTLGDEFKSGACHAGRYETSLVLAAGHAIRADLAATLPPLPVDLAQAIRDGKRDFREAGAERAYFGEPAAASAAEGETLYAALVQVVLTVIGETWPELA
jgi:creatinine amidohydrolase